MLLEFSVGTPVTPASAPRDVNLLYEVRRGKHGANGQAVDRTTLMSPVHSNSAWPRLSGARAESRYFPGSALIIRADLDRLAISLQRRNEILRTLTGISEVEPDR